MVQKTDDVDFDLSKGGEHARDVQVGHTAFLKKRCNPDAASVTFRPKKKHRHSVVKALRLWDNQIRASTDLCRAWCISLLTRNHWQTPPSGRRSLQSVVPLTWVETWCPLHMRVCTTNPCRHSFIFLTLLPPSTLLHPPSPSSV